MGKGQNQYQLAEEKVVTLSKQTISIVGKMLSWVANLKLVTGSPKNDYRVRLCLSSGQEKVIHAGQNKLNYSVFEGVCLCKVSEFQWSDKQSVFS